MHRKGNLLLHTDRSDKLSADEAVSDNRSSMVCRAPLDKPAIGRVVHPSPVACIDERHACSALPSEEV